MPKLAAFPKAYMDPLCVDGSMSVREWIELAAKLRIDGLEFYTGFLELADPKEWTRSRDIAADHGLTIPMLCCSPDFTHPDAAFRREQIDREKSWIDMTAALGGHYCRVLSGQRRPDLTLQFLVENFQFDQSLLAEFDLRCDHRGGARGGVFLEHRFHAVFGRGRCTVGQKSERRRGPFFV